MGDRVYLDVASAAEFLDTTENHIKYLVKTRQIPHTRLGRKLRFDRRRLDDWMKANTTEPA